MCGLLCEVVWFVRCYCLCVVLVCAFSLQSVCFECTLCDAVWAVVVCICVFVFLKCVCALFAMYYSVVRLVFFLCRVVSVWHA